MKSACTLLLVLLLFVSLSAVQTMQAQAPARTDVYHVHLAKAALGKGAEEGEQLKKQGPKAPMPGHLIVLRHQSGEDWDYAVIEHLGTKATIDATGNAPSAAAGDLNACTATLSLTVPPGQSSPKPWDLTTLPRALGRSMLSRSFALLPDIVTSWKSRSISPEVVPLATYCSSILRVGLGTS